MVKDIISASALAAVLTFFAIAPDGLALDRVRSSVHVDALHSGIQTTNGLQTYTGRGVVVGIIDYGFDYTHPAFRSADLSELRIRRVWEQGAEGQAPAAYGYGLEMTEASEILAAGGDITDNSHGTHVACIAAGQDISATGIDCPYYGMAPDADLVLVSINGREDDDHLNIIDAIHYVFDYADAVGKPAVVNMSLGTYNGPHDGTSAFDAALAGLPSPGHVIVASVGNSGATQSHLSREFNGVADTLRTLIVPKASTYKQGYIDIWGDAGMEFGVIISTVNSSATNASAGKDVETTDLHWVGGAQADGCTYSDELAFSSTANKAVKMTVKTEVNARNGRPHIYIDFGDDGLGARNNYSVALSIISSSTGTVHAWCEDTYINFGSRNDRMAALGYMDGDAEYSFTELGGTSRDIISVGAWCDREASGETVGEVCTFSSSGTLPDGTSKPDVLAPGAFIASAFSANDTYRAYYTEALTASWADNAVYYYYDSGTSMAAPCVAGVVATWLQADATLTVSDVLSLTPTGKVDALAGLQQILEAMSVETIDHDAAGADAGQSYDLMGRQNCGTSRGFYVRNGRKYVIIR